MRPIWLHSASLYGRRMGRLRERFMPRMRQRSPVRIGSQALAAAGLAPSAFSAGAASRRQGLRPHHLAFSVWRWLVAPVPLHAVAYLERLRNLFSETGCAPFELVHVDRAAAVLCLYQMVMSADEYPPDLGLQALVALVRFAGLSESRVLGAGWPPPGP